ncbi:Uncharacterised protein [Niallia circulans]|uniref:hypothetical protein n=1 Tax=Shouchella clausii TaxID=79880 RepID=UPI000D9E67A3|nr:hypothetical protein [Shouchella clausii]MCM3548421.1 hypothetical protein [Shouchella clausii]SPT78271.1 Uncharacterised protein [Niallia circulans]
MKKKGFIYLIISLLLTATMTFIISKSSSFVGKEEKENDPFTETEPSPSNAIGISAYKEEDVPLLDHDYLEVKDGKSGFHLVIHNEVEEERNYGVIVFQDYQQTGFRHQGKEIPIMYEFTAAPQSDNVLPIELDIIDDATEVIALIVKDPQVLTEEMDFDKLFFYEQVFAKRYIIEDSSINKKLAFSEPSFIYDSVDDQTTILFSPNAEEEFITSSMKSNDDAYLFIGSPFVDEGITYAVIALKDWQQINLTEENGVLYTKVNANEKHVYPVKVPEVKEAENLQFISFPYPYEVWDDRYAFKVEQTVRAVIVP